MTQLDRRRFLLASSAAGLGMAAVACSSDADDPGRTDDASPTSAGPGGAAAATAAAALHPVGSRGLMDEAVYQRRVDEYLKIATAVDQSGNPVGIASHLIRATRDPDYTWSISDVTVESLDALWKKIDAWEDTRDFTFMYLHWLLALGQGETPMTQLDPSVIEAITRRMLDNRYRYDDPMPADRIDNLWFWSENHIIIGRAIEYLAGQRFGDVTFTITGLTGAQHLERSREPILEWVRERAKLGFFEWHSNVYMLKNIQPLLMLAELADDPEIVTAAAMALDLCLVDLAAHTHRGCYTAARGRTYKKDKTSSLDEATFGTAKFVFDDTTADYPSTADGGATYLCAAQRYRPPQVVIDMATDDATSVVRERHGVFFDGASPVTEDVEAPYGKDFEDPANLPFWWSLGALGMWPLARVSVAEADEHRLWDAELMAQVKLLASLNGFDPERIRPWMQERAAVINFGFLSEANTYAYRTPKVSLASVLDHRFGEMRDQAHAWQAAIDENAMVFTNHPVTDADESIEWGEDGRPGYWTGEASMPRSAQHEGTAIHIYQPRWDESTDPLVWGVFGYRPFTHAFVPQDHFDEVRQVGNWTVAAKDGAFIALWSWRPPTWRVYDPARLATRGMAKPFDLVAEGGPDNVWVVEVGEFEGAVGSIDDAVAALTAAEPTVTRDAAGFTVAWTSPSTGALGFGSTGPFTVDGVEQSLSDFPRHDSPWGTVEHLDMRYRLKAGGSTWSGDYESLERMVG